MKLRRIQQIVFALLIVNGTYGQNPIGRYEGALSRDGSVQLVNFDFYKEAGILKATYEIPEIAFFDVPIDQIKIINDTLHLKFYYGNFFCFLGQDQITGISEKWNPKLRLHVKKTFPREKPYIKEEIEFKNGAIQLAGMLYQPKHALKKPVDYVVLVHGSGAQDRFSPYYISLAYSLAKRGFGVLLYDKRGTGASSGDFEKASLEELAGDALAALNYLKSRKDIKKSEIGFLGTSQGGWIAPIAANKSKDCDFLILNVGPAVSVFEQDIHRVKYSMEADGWKSTAIDSAILYTKLYFQYVRNGKVETWEKLISFSKKIKTSSWVNYVNLPDAPEDLEWWKLNDYDPEESLKNLKCRTLCLFAEFDPLVPPQENEPLMKKYLNEAGVAYEIHTIKESIHDMQSFQGLNGDNWNWPVVYWQWRKQALDFLNSITQFLNRK